MAVEASLVAFAFGAGALTFFAPCAYPLLPGYLSYYLGRTTAGAGAGDPGDRGTAETAGGAGREGAGPPAAPPDEPADGGAPGSLARLLRPPESAFASPSLPARLARAAVVGAVVSAGFFLVYGVLVGVVVAAGSRVLAGISVLELLVGALLILAGAAMAADWKPSRVPVRLPERRRSLAGFFGFGVLYAAAAAGCTAPVFVAVAARSLAAGPVPSLLAFGAYAAGMSSLMVAVTVAAALGREALLSRLRRHRGLVTRIAGVLLAAAGVVQVYLFLFRFDGLRTLRLA